MKYTKNPPENTPRTAKKKSPARAVIAILLVLLLGVGTGAALVFGGVLDGLFGTKPKNTAEAYFATGPVAALRLAAAPGGSDAAALREYYQNALDYAAAAGLNTVIFEAKTGFYTQWRDKTLPAAPDVTAQDSLFSKLDPLEILLEEAQGRNLQVWLDIEPTSIEGYQPGDKGSAAKYLKKNGLSSAAEHGFVDLLVQSYASLPESYPVAGLLFTGVDDMDETSHLVVAGVRGAFEAAGLPTKIVLESSTSALTTLRESADGLVYSVESGDSMRQSLERVAKTGDSTTYYLAPKGEYSELMLFTAMQDEAFGGAVLTEWPQAESLAEVALLRAAYTEVDSVLPVGYTIPGTLMITNPADGLSVAHSVASYFVAGISVPGAGELTVNGTPVATTDSGFWGILVPLQYGANTVTVQQGGESDSISITRQSPPTTSGGGGTPPVYTQEPGNGLYVQISNVLGYPLTDVTNLSSINEVFYGGATSRVEVIQLSDGKPVAYQIPSGDWLAASAVEEIGKPGADDLGTLRATAAEGGEYLDFANPGTPGAYIHYMADSNTLRLTFYDTALEVPAGFSSEYVRAARTEAIDGGVELYLDLNPVWGYQIEYVDGYTRLFLKRVPVYNEDGSLPLAGITVLLDPGHGGQDKGASANTVGPHLDIATGPNEKELSLATAEAVAYRLRQLGAEVVFTRESNDEEATSKSPQRLEQMRELKPDFFVSFHRNSMNHDTDLNTFAGTEVFYYHPYSVANSIGFAQNLVNSIAGETGRSNRGVKWSYFNVTVTSVCPAALVEYGFVSNPAEYAGMLSTEDITIEAEATVQAILATLRGEEIE